jgi:prolyl 4-hydroxylase
MRIYRISSDPKLFLIQDFVSDSEAASLIVAADQRFRRSATVCDTPGGCAVPERTSSSAAVPASRTTEAVQGRGKALARLPQAEAIQVVRYSVGQEFKPHLDAFDRAYPGGGRALSDYDGRQRDATVLIYLSGPEAGGETVFPALGLSVAPVPRAALLWWNVRPDGSIDRRMLHGGAPVRKGVKYAANLWLRGRALAAFS